VWVRAAEGLPVDYETRLGHGIRCLVLRLKNGEFLEYYHKRSNAETTFHMIKSKFGDSVRSETEVAQINEVLLKVLCHNICVVIQEMFELGIESSYFSA
jgi:transposase